LKPLFISGIRQAYYFGHRCINTWAIKSAETIPVPAEAARNTRNAADSEMIGREGKDMQRNDGDKVKRAFAQIKMRQIVAIAAAVGFLAYQKSEQNYQKAIQSELPDKCATPPGYTDEQWKEHMSHHPDMYERCL